MSQSNTTEKIPDDNLHYILIPLGILINIYMIFCLFSKEQEAKNSYLGREFARNNCVETSAESIDSEKDGKIVYFTGMISSDDTLSDKVFNISVDKCLTLKRKVEMYQYYEKKHEHRERTGKKSYRTYYSYSYHKDWFEYIKNSNSFKRDNNYYKNPNKMKFKSQLFNAKNLSVGAYKIPSSSIVALGTPEKIHLASFSLIMPNTAIVEDNKILYNAFNEDLEAGEDKKEIIPIDEKKPEIGDTRISFYKYPLCEVTVFGVQNGENMYPFSKNGFTAHFVIPGKKTVDEMLNTNNIRKSSIDSFRFFSFIVLSIGFCFLFYNVDAGCACALSASFGVVSGIACCVWFSVIPFVSTVWLSILIFICIAAFSNPFKKNK